VLSGRAGPTKPICTWVQIDLEKDDHDHLISPDEQFRIAMARQQHNQDRQPKPGCPSLVMVSRKPDPEGST
jgi:hypothetical protein